MSAARRQEIARLGAATRWGLRRGVTAAAPPAAQGCRGCAERDRALTERDRTIAGLRRVLAALEARVRATPE